MAKNTEFSTAVYTRTQGRDDFAEVMSHESQSFVPYLLFLFGTSTNCSQAFAICLGPVSAYPTYKPGAVQALSCFQSL